VLARTVPHALVGLEPRRVEVEAHLQRGVPSFAIVGLADRACQEAKHRVLEWPLRRLTVNLAPADLRKEGPGFDLPIALAVLGASRQLSPESLAGQAAIGELALDGRLRPVPDERLDPTGRRTCDGRRRRARSARLERRDRSGRLPAEWSRSRSACRGRRGGSDRRRARPGHAPAAGAVAAALVELELAGLVSAASGVYRR